MATISIEHLYRNNEEQRKAVKVGDPATLLMYSDSHAATVVHVSPSGKTITVQQDVAIRTDENGQSESQTYEYRRNPNGAAGTYRWSEKEGWSNKQSTLGARRCLVGVRREWRDPTF